MRREFHVRFCEGAGVRFPRATRLVFAFQRQVDAERFFRVLPKRLAKYGLELSAEKSRLVRFSRYRVGKKSEKFDFLGFEFRWVVDPKGTPRVTRRTSRKRLRASLARVTEWVKAEIKPGRAISQQGLAATCKDSLIKEDRGGERDLVWRMSHISDEGYPDIRTPGSVRGASGNRRLYRDSTSPVTAPGTSRVSNFAPGWSLLAAKESFIAPLSQKLLTHPNGSALAVIGHVGGAWTHWIQWPGAGRYIEAFEEVVDALLVGKRVGAALEAFGMRYADQAVSLSDLQQEEQDWGIRQRDEEIIRFWTGAHDTRSFIVLGDPAVRLSPAPAQPFW